MCHLSCLSISRILSMFFTVDLSSAVSCSAMFSWVVSFSTWGGVSEEEAEEEEAVLP